MQDILILEPIFKERIWGGNKLARKYAYNIPSDKTGECWAISAHRNGDCKITNGKLKGYTLSNVYNNHRELFNNISNPTFPLLTKILDASSDLSVQVHPNDEYASKYENDLGKTECWYIIDCDEDAEIIIGHNALSKNEMINMIENNEWNILLRKIKVKPGDFFYIPTGTIHAICKGIVLLETQQSSDTTYRVYDYDRLDDNGNKRELHLDKAIEVITVPHKDEIADKKVTNLDNLTITEYVSTKYFTVQKWEIDGQVQKELSKFKLISVLDGKGTINNLKIKKGDHFIITSTCNKINLNGNLELIVSHV